MSEWPYQWWRNYDELTGFLYVIVGMGFLPAQPELAKKKTHKKRCIERKRLLFQSQGTPQLLPNASDLVANHFSHSASQI